MIPESEVERAVDYLRDSADKAAMARATRIYLEQWLKAKKAILASQKIAEGVGVSENWALAHPEYQQALEDYRSAVQEDERCRFLREAADAKVRAWQTMCSNERAVGRIV